MRGLICTLLSLKTRRCRLLACFLSVSCISDETVRQLSAKDRLSKHYQVPVFKFIGTDNRVCERAHRLRLRSPVPYITLSPAVLLCWHAKVVLESSRVDGLNSKGGQQSQTYVPVSSQMLVWCPMKLFPKLIFHSNRNKFQSFCQWNHTFVLWCFSCRSHNVDLIHNT